MSARPAAGKRFVFEKTDELASAVSYVGFVHLPDADLPLTARVELPGGAVKATVVGGTPELEKTAAALLRAGTKSELTAKVALPRKIVRWRG